MRQFAHMELPTGEQQPNKMYAAQTKVRVTALATYPYRVEYVRNGGSRWRI